MTEITNYLATILLIIAICRATENAIEEDKAICLLPIDEGDCESDSVSSSTETTNATVAYGFNNKTTKCEQFVYEGCAGNKNRFGSDFECQKICYTPLNYFIARVAAVLNTKYP